MDVTILDTKYTIDTRPFNNGIQLEAYVGDNVFGYKFHDSEHITDAVRLEPAFREWVQLYGSCDSSPLPDTDNVVNKMTGMTTEIWEEMKARELKEGKGNWARKDSAGNILSPEYQF